MKTYPLTNASYFLVTEIPYVLVVQLDSSAWLRIKRLRVQVSPRIPKKGEGANNDMFEMSSRSFSSRIYGVKICEECYSRLSEYQHRRMGCSGSCVSGDIFVKW